MTYSKFVGKCSVRFRGFSMKEKFFGDFRFSYKTGIFLYFKKLRNSKFVRKSSKGFCGFSIRGRFK
jgi:hypothetical protein